MIDRKELVRALDRHGVAEWTVIERDQELAVVDDAAPGLGRAERRVRWHLTVRVDGESRRGSAHVAIDGSSADADEIVRHALGLAAGAIGPMWQATPPAAPARVRLIDDQLAATEPLLAAAGVLRGLRRRAGTTVTGAVHLAREHVSAETQAGFRTSWLAALVRAELLVSDGARALAVTREARQLADLRLDDAIDDAAADLARLAVAGAPAAGPCALVLDAEAMLAGGLGVWEAFASQADAVVERQGLTRYRETRPIVPGAEAVAEPLSIASDGALDYGTRSAPLGDEGDAVRRFPLVERGVAAGLGLSPHEAALRHRDPNGGVRNLVVATGSWSGGATDAGAGRVVEVRRLRGLAIEPYTGEASLELGLALDGSRPFAGGTIRLDLIAALAHARRSSVRLRRGAYDGPAAVWIDRAELIV